MTNDPPGMLPIVGELSLSAERRAELAPKLAALLEDLRKLEDLERPELEPARPRNGDNDAGR